MSTTGFPHLFSPLDLRGLTIRNRIVSSGHDTVMIEDGRITDQLVAYQRARASGGAGLIVAQVGAVHSSARYTAHVLDASSDGCIAGYRALASAVHAEGSAIVGQLFHPGREVMDSLDGTMPVAVAPSSVPTERFARTPRALSEPEVLEIIDGYAAAARRLISAGLDGVEVVMSHGYLPAQFLSPHVNRRDDSFGGDALRRSRFLDEVLNSVRREIGESVLGLRLCLDERDPAGLTPPDVYAYLERLVPRGLLDYLSLTTGTSATRAGASHIVPDMSHPNAYLASQSGELRRRTGLPVIVAGRINQPQDAERLLENHDADACVMTRALICDPQLPHKAASGDLEGIRACVACNQACIGHFHAGFAISCIQHPETGRELRFSAPRRSKSPRRVLVIGAGPGGLKAAAALAERGHDVEVHEASRQLGGQVRLAGMLPEREEFAGIVDNLALEAHRAGARILTSSRIGAYELEDSQVDFVVVASGSRPQSPALETIGDPVLLSADDVLLHPPSGTRRVVVADVFAQWTGAGVARQLSRLGHEVTLALIGRSAGEGLQQYVRDAQMVGLTRDRVRVLVNTRLAGADEDTAFCQDVLTDDVIQVPADLIVHVTGRVSALDDALRAALAGLPHVVIGDALAPRTVEEAVLEGLLASELIEETDRSIGVSATH